MAILSETGLVDTADEAIARAQQWLITAQRSVRDDLHASYKAVAIAQGWLEVADRLREQTLYR